MKHGEQQHSELSTRKTLHTKTTHHQNLRTVRVKTKKKTHRERKRAKRLNRIQTK